MAQFKEWTIPRKISWERQEERQDTTSTKPVRGHLSKKDKFQKEDKGARILELDSSSYKRLPRIFFR